MEHNPLIEQRTIDIMPQIVGPDYKAQWHPNLSNENYHLDRSALSSSGLKTLIMKSPAHFKTEWIKGSDGKENKKELKFGTLAHMALLEPDKFKDSYVTEPIFQAPTLKGEMSTRSKEALKLKEEWYSSLKPGQLVVTEEEMVNITGIINTILNHQKAPNMIKGADIEMSGYFRDPTTGIKCRIRPDVYHQDKRVLIDFKTTVCSDPRIFPNQIAKLMYHVSLIFYGQGIKAITGKEPEIYAFIASEKEDPWATSIVWLSPQDIETAKLRFFDGMDWMKRCIKMNKWPAYQTGQAEQITLPPWAHTQPTPMYDLESEEI